MDVDIVKGQSLRLQSHFTLVFILIIVSQQTIWGLTGSPNHHAELRSTRLTSELTLSCLFFLQIGREEADVSTQECVIPFLTAT